MEPLVISASRDFQAGVWVAENEKIGLITEAPTLDALAAKLPDMIRDLLEGDGDGKVYEIKVPYKLVAHFHEVVHVGVDPNVIFSP